MRAGAPKARVLSFNARHRKWSPYLGRLAPHSPAVQGEQLAHSLCVAAPPGVPSTFRCAPGTRAVSRDQLKIVAPEPPLRPWVPWARACGCVSEQPVEQCPVWQAPRAEARVT